MVTEPGAEAGSPILGVEVEEAGGVDGDDGGDAAGGGATQEDAWRGMMAPATGSGGGRCDGRVTDVTTTRLTPAASRPDQRRPNVTASTFAPGRYLPTTPPRTIAAVVIEDRASQLQPDSLPLR